MTGPLITKGAALIFKGAAQAKTLPFLSFPWEVFSGIFLAVLRTDHGREFDNEVQFGAFCDAQGITHNFSTPRTPQSNGVIERKNVEESLKVTFDESPSPTKLSPLVDDDVGEEEAIERNIKVGNNNNIEDESIEIDEVVNIKESKSHPLEQVIELKNVNEALGDKSWVVAMQEELNQFVANDVSDLVPLSKNQSIIGTKWVFRNKLDENGIVSRNKARFAAQGYNQQEGIDYDETYAL
ncbi:retrovirus-related pol polyprotein from transposon TNT 1-94, partial [Tanacetum coccineum]